MPGFSILSAIGILSVVYLIYRRKDQ
ncbi:Heimdall-CTERM domain-containing surface protein [Methanococcoides methylutens]